MIVPDSKDMGLNALPKQSHPTFFFQKILDSFPNVVLAENPCKFRVFGKDCVIVKQEYLIDLTRVSVASMNPNVNSSSHLFETVVNQLNLCPMSR